MTAQSDILWDVQEQHLDEAGFSYEQWEAALDSPLYTLHELETGPEARMLAHVHGLITGGEPVVERLLLPVLEDVEADPNFVFVASHVILSTASTQRWEAVTGQLEGAKGERWEALVRALELSEREGLDSWIAHGIEQCSEPGLAGRLRALASHGVSADARVLDWLRSSEPQVAEAACRWVRGSRNSAALDGLRGPLVSEHPRVRRAALDSACICSPELIWPWVLQHAQRDDDDLRDRALLWVALLGGADVHARLIDELGRRVAPWPVGFSGRVAAVDAAVGLLDDETFGPQAGELIQAICGLPDDEEYWQDTEADKAQQDEVGLPEFEDDDLEVEPVPEQEADLRRPQPDTIARWWSQERSRYDPGVRYIGGVPMERRSLIVAMASQSCRRIHGRGLELGARTRGHMCVQTRALTARQRADLDAMPDLQLQAGLG